MLHSMEMARMGATPADVRWYDTLPYQTHVRRNEFGKAVSGLADYHLIANAQQLAKPKDISHLGFSHEIQRSIWEEDKKHGNKWFRMLT